MVWDLGSAEEAQLERISTWAVEQLDGMEIVRLVPVAFFKGSPIGFLKYRQVVFGAKID